MVTVQFDERAAVRGMIVYDGHSRNAGVHSSGVGAVYAAPRRGKQKVRKKCRSFGMIRLRQDRMQGLLTLVHIFDQTLNIVLLVGDEIQLFDVSVREDGSHGQVLGELGF